MQDTFFGPCLLAEVDEPIVLINDTPDVEINEAAVTASVRVDFTLRSDIILAECSLGANFPPTDCEHHNNILCPSYSHLLINLA